MDTVIFVIAMTGLVMLIVGCGGKQSVRPEDFNLSFYWDSGALPPQYRFEYVITIGPGTQGELDFLPGYENAEGSERWVTSFVVSSEALENLYTYFAGNDLLRSRWNTGRGLIGGSTTSLIVRAFGNETQIPCISELKEEDKHLVEQAMDVVRRAVPESVWEEMTTRQKEFENNYK